MTTSSPTLHPSPTLQALLASLSGDVVANKLILNSGNLGGTAAAGLLQLMSDDLGVSLLSLDPVVLPGSVTDDTLTISGGNPADVTITIAFQELSGEIAIQLLVQAPTPTPLNSVWPSMPDDFFAGTVTTPSSATVTVPGLGSLAFTTPTYGIIGLVSPSGGFVTTSIAPRLDGLLTPSGATTAKSGFVEITTATTGFRIGPLDGGWSFADVATLLTGFPLLQQFPAIISTSALNLRTFDLNLFPEAPDFSSLTLDVANTTDPAGALWSAIGDKVQLTDVLVTIDLTYASPTTIAPSGTGSVQGNITVGTIPLAVSIPFPPSGIWTMTAYPNVALTDLADLADLLSSSAPFYATLPPDLAGLDTFELTFLRIAVDASTLSLVDFTVALGSTATWTLVTGVVELTSIQARLSVDGTGAVWGEVIGTLGIGSDGALAVTFGRATAQLPWRLDAVSPAIPLASLGDLARLAQGVDLRALVKVGGLDQFHFVMSDVNFGMTFGPTALSNLGLTLQLAGAGSSLDPTLDWVLIPSVLTLTRFAFGFQLTFGTTPSSKAFGSFVLNGLEFDITFAEQARQGVDTDALIAEYSAQGAAGTVDVQALIHSISPTVAAYVPAGIEIEIADAVLAYLGSGATKKFVFAMDIAVEFGISDLPLVGQALPEDAVVGIKQLKVVVASDALSADEVAFVNGLSTAPVVPAPAAGTAGTAIPAGFSVIAELQLGELSILLTSPPVADPTARSRTLALATPTPTPTNDPVAWIDVQKTYGPVSIAKIGFSYSGGAVKVVANMGLAVAGLDIELIGIGFSSPLTHPAVGFTIHGLAVSYAEGPVSIAGGLLGTLEPLDFAGALSVRAPGIILAAFAGYSTYEDHPSFFLYGVLDVPLGGPPPFFVTGLAAGLGFNRTLVVPDVSGVASFPLVAWATGDGTPPMDPAQPVGNQVANALALLAQSGVVAPSVGDYWFAAGVAFTSFQVVSSFALLTVTLGTDVEIALLGLSTLTLPAKAASPVAQIQLALEVSFSSGSGLLAVAGQLTDNSYVLSPDGRLTGGFAFSLWFGGDHAGDFVITLGGYNPTFTLPAHYPNVPRLGLTWQVIPELSITGGLYFALTANAVMAGGKLSAVWNSGGVRAWFTYWADFLMTLTPFHYYVEGGVDIGASFTVRTRFFSLSQTVHVGVTLELWGPPFAGRAVVNLSVISFTIAFPARQPDVDASTSVAWSIFADELLPGTGAVSITVTDGLVRALEPTAGGPCYLVNAETFRCSVLTVIPTKVVMLDPDPVSGFANLAVAPDAAQPGDGQGHPTAPNTNFGAGPAGLQPSAFQPTLELSLTGSAQSVLQVVRQLGSAPKAMWENKQFDSHGVPIIDPLTGLTATTIPNVLLGLGLVPAAGAAGHTCGVPLPSLLYAADEAVEQLAWGAGVPPTTDAFDQEKVATTITASTVGTVRSALLSALAGQGVTTDTAVDVAQLADPAGTDLQAAPRLQLLGEQTA